jgi:hypothetical protein
MSIFDGCTLHQAGAFFVTRAKRNMKDHRVYSHEVNKKTGISADQSIALDGFYTSFIPSFLEIKESAGA